MSSMLASSGSAIKSSMTVFTLGNLALNIAMYIYNIINYIGHHRCRYYGELLMRFS